MGQVKVRRIRQPHIIDSRPTGRLGLALLLVAVALGSWAYLAFDLTGETPFVPKWPVEQAVEQPAEQPVEPADLTELKQTREALQDETAQLEQRLQTLTKDHQEENKAVREAQERIRVLQTENAQLRSQVAFLTQLFGGDDGPLDISDLALSRESDNRFRYWFKVSRTNASTDMLTGQVRLQLRGQLQGEERYFSLDELTDDSRDSHRLGFRHFQEIDGTLQLPQDFQPEELLVVVVPDDEATGGARRQFPWQTSQDADAGTDNGTGPGE
ncbi:MULTISPECIES: DUF6776 family protein [Thiorhodovibrio]|uniref:DUF6776 family protein n=1 Tax=Thiorhodovibrio TaxID=61593 RepID=UPI001912C794|nr:MULTISPECIES: DUF6776 family protein [Thiorhodovibrio]MBK5970939.1 hypothetical protein [Thiorhodovibrio winogradskyi]